MSAKKAEVEKVVKKSRRNDNAVERKIEAGELISLQREGKLMQYDSSTRIGLVREVGLKTEFPEGEPKAA